MYNLYRTVGINFVIDSDDEVPIVKKKSKRPAESESEGNTFE